MTSSEIIFKAPVNEYHFQTAAPVVYTESEIMMMVVPIADIYQKLAALKAMRLQLEVSPDIETQTYHDTLIGDIKDSVAHYGGYTEVCRYYDTENPGAGGGLGGFAAFWEELGL